MESIVQRILLHMAQPWPLLVYPSWQQQCTAVPSFSVEPLVMTSMMSRMYSMHSLVIPLLKPYLLNGSEHERILGLQWSVLFGCHL